MDQILYTNPWMGTQPYNDPQSAVDSPLFCGRNKESYDLTALIEDNIFVTLYGRSGCGKTSLLNAGVFPILRQKGYLPVSFRLGREDRPAGKTIQRHIVDKVMAACSNSEKGRTVKDYSQAPDEYLDERIPECQDEQDPKFLWTFFARKRFYDAGGRKLFPVIVLDQFEEILHANRAEADLLLRQIYYLMDENHAMASFHLGNGEEYYYDYNFRFVVSIREDDLYLLEDYIDDGDYFDMKISRYRLRNLTEEKAREVILKPAGKGFFKEEEKESIADTILSCIRTDDENPDYADQAEEIVTIKLSIILSQLAQAHGRPITLATVKSIINEDPVGQLYKKNTILLSAEERRFIASRMVDHASRRRLPVPLTEFSKKIVGWKELVDNQGGDRIFHYTKISGQKSVELIHDAFCEPAIQDGETLEARGRLMRRVVSSVVLFFIVVVVGLFSFFLYLDRNKISSQEDQLITKMIPTYASDSPDGDIDLAIRLLLYKYAKTGNENASDTSIIRPVVADLMKATSGNYVLGKHDSRIRAIGLVDGDLLTVSIDSVQKRWNLATLKGKLDTLKVADIKGFAVIDKKAEGRMEYITPGVTISAHYVRESSTFSDEITLSDVRLGDVMVKALEDKECNGIYQIDQPSADRISFLAGSHRYLYRITAIKKDGRWKIEDRVETYRLPGFNHNNYTDCCEDESRFYLAYGPSIRIVNKVKVLVGASSQEDPYSIKNFYLSPDDTSWLYLMETAEVSHKTFNRVRRLAIGKGLEAEKTIYESPRGGDPTSIIAAYQDPKDANRVLVVLKDRAFWIKDGKKEEKRELNAIRFRDMSMDYALLYMTYIDTAGIHLFSLERDHKNETLDVWKPSDGALVVSTLSQSAENGYHKLFCVTDKGDLHCWSIEEKSGSIGGTLPLRIQGGETYYAHRLTSNASAFVVCKMDTLQKIRKYDFFHMHVDADGKFLPIDTLAVDKALGNITGITPVTNTVPSLDLEGIGIQTLAIIESNSGLVFYPNTSLFPFEAVHKIAGEFTQVRFPSQASASSFEEYKKKKAYISTAKGLMEYDMDGLLPVASLWEKVKAVYEDRKETGFLEESEKPANLLAP